MFYLIGLGLNEKSLSIEAVEILKRCKKIYFEAYTIEMPFSIEKVSELIGDRIINLTRLMVENEKFIEEGRHQDIALLVYGSPLIATTHISLILKCKELGIKYRIIHNASILDAISESGLQVYKFGKTASMPKWNEKYKPESFIKIIKENKKINAHTLILVDIGLSYDEALRQLEEACNKKVKIDKIVVCSKLGTEEQRVLYGRIGDLAGEEVYAPFCIIIPGKLHFIEEEALNKI